VGDRSIRVNACGFLVNFSVSDYNLRCVQRRVFFFKLFSLNSIKNPRGSEMILSRPRQNVCGCDPICSLATPYGYGRTISLTDIQFVSKMTFLRVSDSPVTLIRAFLIDKILRKKILKYIFKLQIRKVNQRWFWTEKRDVEPQAQRAMCSSCRWNSATCKQISRHVINLISIYTYIYIL